MHAMPRWLPLFFAGLAIASYVIGAVFVELIERRNFKRTGSGGGGFYARCAGILGFALFTLCALAAQIRLRR